MTPEERVKKVAGVEEEAVSFIEWVYANPGHPAENYGSILAKIMVRIHKEAETAAYERAAQLCDQAYNSPDFNEGYVRIADAIRKLKGEGE